MNNTVQEAIKRDRQIIKFSWYGLLKNLRFFEPYLLIYLLADGITYTQIGALMAIREVIIYIFEIPSGVIADQFGKKKEMMLCFTFYIVSFVFFFLQGGFSMYLIAMVFYGLGDAFRSGTHKAMIMQYLQEKEWGDHKSFVYGRTRSFSLIGSAVSSILSVLLVLFIPGLRWVFLVCIFPYIADFLLIASYPNRLDRTEGVDGTFNLKKFWQGMVDSLKTSFAQPALRTMIFNSSTFQGTVKSIKDYVQPMLSATLIAEFAITDDTTIKVILGIFYFAMNLLNSAASRNAYRVSERFSASTAINVTFLIMGAAIVLTGTASLTNATLLVMVCYTIINIASNIRRPLLVGSLSDLIEPKLRASVLSVESQMTSVFTAIGAFLIGFSVDRIGLSTTFLVLGGLLMVLQFVLRIQPVPDPVPAETVEQL